jgi:hypothetical protein
MGSQPTRVTVADWLAELLEAEQARVPDGALTAAQLADRAGKPKAWVLARLSSLKREGRLRVVRVRTEAIDGSWRWSPAYVVMRTPDARGGSSDGPPPRPRRS